MILEQVQQRPRLLVGRVERHHASRSVEILARLERTIGGAAPGDVAVTGGRLICAAASVPVSNSTEGKWHRLPVEPHILEAPAVEDAVDDKVETLHARPPARRDTGIEDDRARGVARQPALDLPHQLPPLLGVGLGRLPVDQRVDFLVTEPRVVAI